MTPLPAARPVREALTAPAAEPVAFTEPRSDLRVLIVNGDLPIFPGRAGHEYLHTTRLARLASRVGLVSLVHLREQLEGVRTLAEAGVQLYLWRSPGPPGASPRSWRRRLLEGLHGLRTFPRRPTDTAAEDLKLRNMAPHLLAALGDGRWDALVVVQSWDAHFVAEIPRLPVSVLVMHDVRALVYERRAAVTTARVRRLRWRVEAALYRRWERRWCRRYDLVVTVSAADEAFVRARYAPRRLVTVPIPVDGEYFRPDPGRDGAEVPGRIVFTGLMDHPPNVDAACFFAREVFPAVRARVPGAEFRIVGTRPAPAVRALGALPGVAVTGAVPDIRPELARAAVVVVPLRFASGMRNKILEAWGMEKCVVSTTIGAEGLEYRDGADILVADGAAALAERVVAALGDPALRAAVGRAGREIVTGRHRPDALARSYHGAIAAVVAEGRRADRPLRAVVDLRWMRPGVAGGIESLSRAFVRHLVRLDGYNRYTVLVPSEARFEFDARRSANVRIEVTDGPAALARRVLWRGASALHRRLGLDYWRSPEVETLRAAARRGADVVFSPAGWIQPDVAPSRNLLVVVDLQHEIRPEFFTPAVAAERRRVVGGSIRQADHLIAISEHTRRSVIERLGIDPRRITTLHLAADPVFHPDRRVPGRTRAVLARHGLAAGTYLLFPANTWPHKNHAGALRALALLRDAHRLTPSLVLTGAPKEAEPEVHRLAGALGLDGQVRFLGYCPVDDMPALYEGAAALFFPSFFEGFGLPLVEAMWSGCPIVASRATSLPEVAGDAALLVNPDAPEEMAAALARVLESDDLRRDLVARGRARAPRFSWATFTRETIRLLREVATGELSR